MRGRAGEIRGTRGKERRGDGAFGRNAPDRRSGRGGRRSCCARSCGTLRGERRRAASVADLHRRAGGERARKARRAGERRVKSPRAREGEVEAALEPVLVRPRGVAALVPGIPEPSVRRGSVTVRGGGRGPDWPLPRSQSGDPSCPRTRPAAQRRGAGLRLRWASGAPLWRRLRNEHTLLGDELDGAHAGLRGGCRRGSDVAGAGDGHGREDGERDDGPCPESPGPAGAVREGGSVAGRASSREGHARGVLSLRL